jgi:hypothetical protein
VPDLWFEDLNGDGDNDLMIDLEGTHVGGGGGSLRINEFGQIAGESNNSAVDGFVIVPETDGDGQPYLWYRDDDGDGANDLQISLGTEAHANDISDGGRVVGNIGPYVDRDYLMQWQIVPPDQVNVVVQEWAKKGGGFQAINENLQAVGYLNDSRYIPRGFLWENGQTLDLVDLLDNPEGVDVLQPRSINDSGTIAAGGFIGVPIAPAPPEPGITVEPVEGLVTTEAGGADTFSVVLDTQPTAPVTIGLSSDDPSEGVVSPESVTFDTDTWATARTVTVTGVDDADADGDVAYAIVTAPAVSGDPDYAGLDADDVAVTNCDDEAGPGPSVGTISPNEMYAGESIPVEISGSGFASGAEVTFENGSGVAPTANVTSVSSTTIEAVVTAHRNAKAAVWDVRVTNPDGSFDVLVGGFTVVP